MPAPLRRRTWTVVLLLLLMHAGAAGTTCPRARAGLCTRGFDLLTNLSWGQCCEACHRLGPSCAGVVYTPLGRLPIMSCYLKSQITGFFAGNCTTGAFSSHTLPLPAPSPAPPPFTSMKSDDEMTEKQRGQDGGIHAQPTRFSVPVRFLIDLYQVELVVSVDSAFLTHGIATWVVLFGSWVLFCFGIDLLGARVRAIRASKLQSDEATGNPQLREQARRLVAARWADILVQTILFAPLLKAAFPLGQERTAMSWVQLLTFFGAWLISNDFLFTIAHRCFHEFPALYRCAHKQHHAYTAPFAWMSHAMSRTEAAANGIAVMAAPFCHALVLGRTTPLELVWFVMVVSQLIGCVEHSGYDALNPVRKRVVYCCV